MQERVVTKEDCLAEIRRFLKNYYVFCQSPDADAVREVLSSGYSLNDKLRKCGYPNFFDNNNFLAIKAIRNHAIHQGEIHNIAKALPLLRSTNLEAELGILCLIPRDIIDRICEESGEKNERAIKDSCVYYKKYVDIYPCIFNFGVNIFLYLEEHNLVIDSVEYLEFKHSIDYEKANGYSHYVKGGIRLLDGGDIDEYLEQHLIDIGSDNKIRDILYEEENGMYTFKTLLNSKNEK